MDRRKKSRERKGRKKSAPFPRLLRCAVHNLILDVICSGSSSSYVRISSGLDSLRQSFTVLSSHWTIQRIPNLATAADTVVSEVL